MYDLCIADDDFSFPMTMLADLLDENDALTCEVKRLTGKCDFKLLVTRIRELESTIAELDVEIAFLNIDHPSEQHKSEIKYELELGHILDPYPHITEWDTLEASRSKLERFFGVTLNDGPRPSVPAHGAWLDGYQFARDLVLKVLK